jgi:hypothetical protein
MDILSLVKTGIVLEFLVIDGGAVLNDVVVNTELVVKDWALVYVIICVL